jgi:hypothetical protein
MSELPMNRRARIGTVIYWIFTVAAVAYAVGDLSFSIAASGMSPTDWFSSLVQAGFSMILLVALTIGTIPAVLFLIGWIAYRILSRERRALLH